MIEGPNERRTRRDDKDDIGTPEFQAGNEGGYRQAGCEVFVLRY
jgi:hypothetical protein